MSSFDDNASTSMITLVSKDGEEVTVSAQAARISGMISNIVEDLDDDDDHVDKLPLPKIDGPSLHRIVQFMNLHAQDRMLDIPLPLDGATLEENVTQAPYRDFINNLDHESLFKLLSAANYLSITPLLDLACLRVTYIIKDKSADEVSLCCGFC